MASTMITSPPSADAFVGLREQIMANASILFPQIVANSYLTTTGVMKPTETFQVIIVAKGESKCALLLHGGGMAMAVAARGPWSNSDEAALSGLLQVTSEALGWHTETLLGELEHPEEVAGGEINYLMVREGFHFAAAAREFEKREPLRFAHLWNATSG